MRGMAGSTNDKISPTHVKDALARINTAYQQHSQVGAWDSLFRTPRPVSASPLSQCALYQSVCLSVILSLFVCICMCACVCLCNLIDLPHCCCDLIYRNGMT